MIHSSFSRRRLWYGSLLVLVPAIALAQPPEIAVTTNADKKSIELSQSLTVTLTVEGPSPLRVELPKQLLVPETARDWRIQAKGPPAVTRLEGTRERWVQVFVLDPFNFGKSMTIAFSPLKVNGRDVSAPSIEVAVDDPKLQLKPQESMTVTGVEQIPPPAAPEAAGYWWWLLLLIPLSAAAVIAWRFRRPPKAVPPPEWAQEEFARLGRDAVGGVALVTAIAAVIRGFIERQFGIPATKFTTAELVAATEQAAWPIEQTDSLRRLLDECDRAKFAGDVPDHDGCRRLLARGREWVDAACPTSELQRQEPG